MKASRLGNQIEVEDKKGREDVKVRTRANSSTYGTLPKGQAQSLEEGPVREETLSFSCSFGVTSRTLLGDIAPGETGVGEEVLFAEVTGPAPLPPVAAATPATPNMPRTFSTALLSPLVQGSRLTSPTPAERLAESRRLDSACRAWRFSSRRGPGPQSCEQPAVAHPPSLDMVPRL
mgnify:CR=1 FL=1